MLRKFKNMLKMNFHKNTFKIIHIKGNHTNKNLCI